MSGIADQVDFGKCDVSVVANKVAACVAGACGEFTACLSSFLTECGRGPSAASAAGGASGALPIPIGGFLGAGGASSGGSPSASSGSSGSGTVLGVGGRTGSEGNGVDAGAGKVWTCADCDDLIPCCQALLGSLGVLCPEISTSTCSGFPPDQQSRYGQNCDSLWSLGQSMNLAACSKPK